MVAEEYPPPTATQGAWALMSPAQVDPGSPLLKPEKKEDTWREERVPTWRTLSPFVKDHVENVVISEYPRNNRRRSRVAAAAQRRGATANVVRQNRPRGMRYRRWKGRRAPSAGCSLPSRTPRDIILVTVWMMPAQSQISRPGGHIPPQILNLVMMQNGNHCREGQPPPLSRGTRAMVRKWGRTVTGQATLSWVEAKSVELRESCHWIVKEMTAILTRTSRRRRVGKRGVEISVIAIMWTSSSEVILKRYPEPHG